MSKGHPLPAPRTSTAATDGLDHNTVKQIQEMVRKYDMAPKIEPPYDKLPAEVQQLQLWAADQRKHWAATDNAYGPEGAERLEIRSPMSHG